MIQSKSRPVNILRHFDLRPHCTAFTAPLQLQWLLSLMNGMSPVDRHTLCKPFVGRDTRQLHPPPLYSMPSAPCEGLLDCTSAVGTNWSALLCILGFVGRLTIQVNLFRLSLFAGVYVVVVVLHEC